MPNTALAPLDTAAEPAIGVEAGAAWRRTGDRVPLRLADPGRRAPAGPDGVGPGLLLFA